MSRFRFPVSRSGVIAVILAAALVAPLGAASISAAPIGPVQAQRDPERLGLVDETTYISPQFDYEITWSDPWEVESDRLFSRRGQGDILGLLNGNSPDTVLTVAGVSTDDPPETLLDVRIAEIEESEGNIDIADVFADERGGTLIATFERDGDDFGVVHEMSVLDDETVLSVEVLSPLAELAEVFESANADIRFDGADLFLVISASDVPEATAEDDQDDEPRTRRTPTPEPDNVDDRDDSDEPDDGERDENGVLNTTYVSPNYGYALNWDDASWNVNTLSTSSTVDGDFLLLESRLSQVSFQSFDGFGGDAETCFESVVEFAETSLFGDGEGAVVESFEPLEDENGDPIEGDDDGRLFGAFQVVLIDENEDEPFEGATYISCQTLVEGQAILAVIHTTSSEDYFDEAPLVEAVVDTIVLSDEPPTRDDEDEPSGTPDTDAGDLDTGEYVSPTYGYELAFDPDEWTVDQNASQAGTDILALSSGPSTLQILGSEDFGGSALTCVNDTIQSIRELEGITTVELDRSNDGTTASGGDEERFFARYTVSVTGGTFASTGAVRVYIECISLDEGDAVLLIQHIVADDEYDDEAPKVDAILETVEITGS